MLALPLKSNRRIATRLAALLGLALTGFGAVLVAPKPAQAQGVFDMGVLTNTVSQDANTQSERRRARGKRGGRTSKAALSGKTTQATYTPSAAVRKRTIANFINDLRPTQPAYADALEKMFATTDFFGLLSRKLAPYGMKTNSVTDAITIYMVTAWYGVRGRNDDPSKTQAQAVRNQLAHVIAAMPGVTGASDARKQQIAENFLLQSLLIDSTITAGKKSPNLMPKAKANVIAQTRAALGLDLTTIKLTDKGLTR